MKELGSEINSNRATVPIVLLTGLLIVAASVVITVALTGNGGGTAGADSLAAPAQQLRGSSSTAAFSTFMQIEGETQGMFETENPFIDREDWTQVFEYNHAVISPRDAASGLPTGRRQHQPIVITKPVDAASPQIFQALVDNENLPTVVIEFERASQSGGVEIYYRVELTNASIAGVRKNFGTIDGDTETISIAYQSITEENTLEGTIAEDDWESPIA